MHAREGGVDQILPIASRYHPEIREPTDKNPGDKDSTVAGHGALVRPDPQLLISNNMIAAMMLNCFYAQQNGRLDYDEVYLDVIANQTRSVRRTKG